MPTIILAKDGVVLQKIPLLKERMRIGRRTYNDVVIDEPNISADHAVIVTTSGNPYFEDRGSTNGSRINGLLVTTKHFLQNEDVVTLGKYTIQYRADANAVLATNPIESLAITESLGDLHQTTLRSNANAQQVKSAAIQILDGPHAGEKIEITQTLTTIGRPDRHVSVFTRTADGYNLTHIRGENFPILNGKLTNTTTHTLFNGDLIDLAGTRILFIN
jgi:hypothetical protein